MLQGFTVPIPYTDYQQVSRRGKVLKIPKNIRHYTTPIMQCYIIIILPTYIVLF